MEFKAAQGYYVSLNIRRFLNKVIHLRAVKKVIAELDITIVFDVPLRS